MFKLIAFALLTLVALSTVNGAAIPRATPPEGWISSILESYDDYHNRYLALGCQNKHNTQFFDDCCHPLKQGETLQNNRKPYCTPGDNPSSTLSEPPSNTLVAEPSSSPAPQPTSVPNSDDDCEDDDDEMNNNGDDNGDDDDCEDEPSYTSSHEPSSTPASVPTPDENPEPTSTPNPVPTPEPSPTSSTDDATPTPVQNTPSNSETHNDAHITWFTQNGVAGACGTVHSDNDFIAALDSRTYGDTGSQSSLCGKTIRISFEGKSVDVVVADACPTCDNPSSVDLSLAAFQALAPLDAGLLTGASWVLL